MALIPKNVNNLHEFGPQTETCTNTIDDEDGNAIFDEGGNDLCTEVVAVIETAMVMTIDASSYQLPLPETGENGEALEYNFLVDWGDGTVERVTAFDASESYHNWGSSGEKTVSITGLCEGWSVLDAGDEDAELIGISQWGNSCYFKYLEGAFYYCLDLVITATDVPNFSRVTSLANFFDEVTTTNIGDLSGWDVSMITDFNNMFANSDINVDISAWDVSSGLDFTRMFFRADMDQDLGTWEPTSATTLSGMFDGTFIGLSVANYDNILIGWSVLTFANTGLGLIVDQKYTAATSGAQRTTLIGKIGAITDLGPV